MYKKITENLERVLYTEDEIKLNCIYSSNLLNDFTEEPVKSGKINKMYGPIKFPKAPENRPYTYASFVTSVDGKIAFEDDTQGPMIQYKNFLDKTEGRAGFWMFNLQRAAADGILVGAGTMKEEPTMTAHCFDIDLESARLENGLNAVPWNIISSLDAKDIPFDHLLFKSPEVPKMINTSPEGLEVVKNNIQNEYIVVGPYNSVDEINSQDLKTQLDANLGKVIVIITGEGRRTNSKVLFKILRSFGIERLLVETPSYTHHLLEEELLDEVFMNYSCIYVGGKAMTIGLNNKSFTSLDHPHTNMLTIFNCTKNPDNYFCFRQSFTYGIKG
ncbi:MAG: dihydrofolate reductase family protein [Fusobacteriaceae bacterium]